MRRGLKAVLSDRRGIFSLFTPALLSLLHLPTDCMTRQFQNPCQFTVKDTQTGHICHNTNLVWFMQISSSSILHQIYFISSHRRILHYLSCISLSCNKYSLSFSSYFMLQILSCIRYTYFSSQVYPSSHQSLSFIKYNLSCIRDTLCYQVYPALTILYPSSHQNLSYIRYTLFHLIGVYFFS